MVNLKIATVVIGGYTFNTSKASYPALPTVYSGAEIIWGSGSCIENSEPARAQLSLWIPKTHSEYIPTLGEVLKLTGGSPVGVTDHNVTLFVGKIESVRLLDDHKVDGGFRVNLVAADALAEAARLRLSASPWNVMDLRSRPYYISAAAADSGVDFEAFFSEEQGAAEAPYTLVTARDVDSMPALEAYQRTLMAIGHTVVSAENKVQPSTKLKLPNVLDLDMTGVTNTYEWLGGSNVSKSVKKVNGVVTRTNEAKYIASPGISTPEFTVRAGTSGVVSSSTNPAGFNIESERPAGVISGAWFGYVKQWTTAATGGSQGIVYTDTGISGASGSKVSAGINVAFNAPKNVKLIVTLYNGATPVGTITGPQVTVPANKWVFLKVDGVTATGAYTKVEVFPQVQTSTNMQVDEKAVVMGIIIEKTATLGSYFDGNTLDAAADAVITEADADELGNPFPTFDSSVLEDSAFEIDTSDVVNQIKIDYFEESFDGTDYVYEEKSVTIDDFQGAVTTTPQQRTLTTDLLVEMSDTIEAQFLYQKARMLLAGQSQPQWRLSGGLKVVLSELPEQVSIKYLLDEATRFGHLVKIGNSPEYLGTYFRVRAGRIVLGDQPSLEFEIEPVEYSAPTSLTSSTLDFDDVARELRIQNFKTLTSNDLRTIGAR